MIPNNTLYIESCYYAESEMNLIMWTWSTKLWSGEGAVGPLRDTAPGGERYRREPRESSTVKGCDPRRKRIKSLTSRNPEPLSPEAAEAKERFATRRHNNNVVDVDDDDDDDDDDDEDEDDEDDEDEDEDEDNDGRGSSGGSDHEDDDDNDDDDNDDDDDDDNDDDNDNDDDYDGV
ncbi:hypothetical protein HZH68_002037 [Vespula germanica]|uniref:Uncharacterized protein n=1 Tax=Vespula germanica TaxID=30212 RepID=A0A834KV55_VESGE|nr:hypothetical protein HZH68_002037 [Vespula germanica]